MRRTRDMIDLLGARGVGTVSDARGVPTGDKLIEFTAPIAAHLLTD